MRSILEVADAAEVIVNGYAFTKAGNNVKVLNLNRPEKALILMKEILGSRPDDEELLYETVVLMDKMGISPTEKINLITSHKASRDDVLTELAKAYNQAFKPDRAIDTLMSHDFVPCERKSPHAHGTSHQSIGRPCVVNKK